MFYDWLCCRDNSLKAIDELPKVINLLCLNKELLTLGLGGRMWGNYEVTIGIHGVFISSCGWVV